MSTKIKILLILILTNYGVSQNSSPDTVYGYFIGVNENGGHYFHNISTSMYLNNVILDGELTNYNACELFYGYNSNILSVDSLYFIPKRIGKTKVYLRNPNNPTLIADSVIVVISKGKKKLTLKIRRAP